MIKSFLSFLGLFKFEVIFILMPVYFAALLISPNFGQDRLGLVFLIVHLLLYPADHLLRSYSENTSSGGKYPLFKSLFVLAAIIAFQLFALIESAKINFWLIGFSTLYIICSWLNARISRSAPPLFSVSFESFYRGAVIVLLVYIGLNDYEPMNLLNFRVFGMMAFVSLFFVALNFSYRSVSQTKSGVSKILTKEIFSMVTITGFLVYLMIFFGTGLMTAFIISILPALLLYVFLLRPVLKENSTITSTRLSIFYFVASTGLNGFFIYSFLKHTNVLQVFS